MLMASESSMKPMSRTLPRFAALGLCLAVGLLAEAREAQVVEVDVVDDLLALAAGGLDAFAQVG